MISLRRGVNLSHWFSQTERRGAEREAWIGEADFARIAELGFDHVRLPLDEEHLWTPQGVREPEAWDLLERALGLASAYGLRAVCDMHILRSHHFIQADEPALYKEPEALEAFCAMWRDLASFLRKYPTDFVALEVLNEAVARDGRDWNRVAARVFEVMRATAPEHTIITGSNWYCMCRTFDELEIPKDPNQILTFHFYNPMCVTHHRAHWTDIGAWEGDVSYPGIPWPNGVPADVPEPLRSRMLRDNIPWGREAMLSEIAPPLRRSKETGLGLYCGEFGVITKAPLAWRQAWIRDAVETLESLGIGWALWDWKGDFGVVDRDLRSLGIEEALLGRK